MELLKNNPGYHTTEYAQLQANRLALRGQSNPLTATDRLERCVNWSSLWLRKINHLTKVQIQASQQVQELKDIILQMFHGNQVVPVGFAADAAAQAVDDIQEPGQEMSAAPVPMDEVYDDIYHSIGT